MEDIFLVFQVIERYYKPTIFSLKTRGNHALLIGDDANNGGDGGDGGRDGGTIDPPSLKEFICRFKRRIITQIR